MKLWVLFVFLLLSFSKAHAVEQSVLLAAQYMLNNGQALEALELLTPLEEEYAGDKQFDYLYGLSLMETGEPANAVFAFQRALAVDANFAGARLDLARSYFDMGQMDLAQREFNILQNQSPPDSVKDVINKYLTAIESRNISGRQGWRGFLQFGIGDDTNVNNATAASSFLGFDLTEESRETGSSVISTLGGARYDLPLGIESKLFFKGSINQRSNSEASYTSTVNYDLLAGYTRTFPSRNDLSFALQAYAAEVDGEANNKGFSLTSQYNINLSAANQMGVFLRLGNVDYVENFNIKDIDQTVTGVSWAHVFAGKSRLSLVLAAILGQDDASQKDSPYGRDFSGLRVSMAYPISHSFNLFASLGQSDSKYDGQFFDLAQSREDSLTDFALGAAWRANKNWILQAVAGLNNNSSNIDLFEYDKTVLMFTARSEFLP